MARRTPPPVDAGLTPVLAPGLERSLGHLTWRANATVMALLADTLPPDVDVHAYATLVALADGRPRSQQEIADAIGVSRTTLTTLAADLTRAGLVDRVRNPDDRRSYLLTRTDRSAAAVEAWRPHLRRLEHRLAESFDTDEYAHLCALLARVVVEGLPVAPHAELLGNLGFLAVRVHKQVAREVGEALSAYDLEPRHLGALRALGGLGPVSQAELARHLGTSAVTVVQVVDGLEARGLVERRRLPTDRRSQVLHRTDAAPALLGRVAPLVESALDRVLAPLSAGERDDLVALLVRFVTVTR